MSFQGDPRLILTANGSSLKFVGGQPVMDQGLENVALISLFTKKGWAGNTLFKNTDQKIGSDFEESTNQPISLSAFNDIRDAAQKSLSDPVFGNVFVEIENPNGYRLNITITIEPPGGDLFELFLTKNGLNWTAQIFDPANRRI